MFADVQFWTDQWEKPRFREGKSEEFWDKRAEFFNSKVNLDSKESSDVYQLLKRKKLLCKDDEVLDIGSGPGRHALPMASEVKQVIATDLSQNMLNYLKENANKASLKNIDTLHADWKDIDLDSHGWNKKFDLVCASMTPGVFNPNTLLKMNEASKGSCYLSGFVFRSDSIWDELKRQLDLNTKDTQGQNNKIYYAFNLLWQLGYHPEISYQNRSWVDKRNIEEAKDFYLSKVALYREVTGNDKEVISNYLKKFQVKGSVEEVVTTKVGVLLWNVEKEKC